MNILELIHLFETSKIEEDDLIGEQMEVMVRA